LVGFEPAVDLLRRVLVATLVGVALFVLLVVLAVGVALALQQPQCDGAEVAIKLVRQLVDE